MDAPVTLEDTVTLDMNQFQEDLKELGILLEETQIRQFIAYYRILKEWNSFMNLTAITEFQEVCKKHFVDSLSIVKIYDFMKSINGDGCRMMDVGTGAGFPGIPIKIVFPHVKVTLLDSLKKRVHFLDEVINRLGLEGMDAIHGRAEDYARTDRHREKYDLCVSRAVAHLSTLSEYCIPFVKVGGKFISYKSEKLAVEQSESGKAIAVLGGKITGQEEFTLPASDIYRNLLVIEKTKPTPKKYPRKAGIPAKEPIQCASRIMGD
jgi:16S rRNA (guanine(527)-N(7))-methyltransferase GidB